MKLVFSTARSRIRQRAWALLAVMSLSATGLLVLAGVMSWADSNSAVIERKNELFATSYAAEAATEKVLSSMSDGFENYGMSVISSNMGYYETALPNGSDDPYFTNFQFFAGTAANSIIVSNSAGSNSVVMGAPYNGLTLTAYTYDIIATAVNKNTMYQIPATIGQRLYLGTIPLFQFAIFYQDYLEIEPNAPMTVNGPVHANGNVYAAPSMGLNFDDSVTAVGNYSQSTNATVTFAPGAYAVNDAAPINLPVGTNTTGTVANTSQNVHAILEPPQAGQTPTDAVGQNLLYNKADMIIIISNDNSITVTSGAVVDGQATQITNWQSFLSTNGTFEDTRDGKTVVPVVINVSNLVTWSATNTVLRPVLNTARPGQGDVQSIYIDDERNGGTNSDSSVTTNLVTNIVSAITTNYSYTTNSTNYGLYVTNSVLPAFGTYVPPPTTINVVNPITHLTNVVGYSYIPIIKVIVTNILSVTTNYTTNTVASYYTNYFPTTTQPGIVLSNGAALPPQGLSIATPDPAYIVGNWNVQNATNAGSPTDAGMSNNTSLSLPSAIYSDAVTVLSSAWSPANSAYALSNRVATSDTVNAAFLTGNVPTTTNGEYSGGVENLARFMENWSGQTFTYNGSMVCLFASQVATNTYPGTGTVFNPPTRTWAFDTNFTDATKQPPMMPKATFVQRNQWVRLGPYATHFPP